MDIIHNWNKSYDNQFMDIWVEHEGWNDQTYLYGVTNGFYYYVQRLENYNDSMLDKVSTEVDNENLPESFWAWRTNWGGDGWYETMNVAQSKGYNVIVFNDSGYIGQLAYCTLEEEK